MPPGSVRDVVLGRCRRTIRGLRGTVRTLLEWESTGLCVYCRTGPFGPVDDDAEIQAGVGTPADVFCRRASDVEDRPDPSFDALSPADYVALAVVDDDVVGWAFVRVERPVTVTRRGEHLRFDGPYVWGLYVDPSMRERGIGNALVTAAGRFASVGEAVPVYALVDEDNEVSRRLFEGLGFELVDEVSPSRIEAAGNLLRRTDTTRRYGTGHEGHSE